MLNPFWMTTACWTIALAANLALAVWWLVRTARHFDRSSISLSAAKRALAFAYAGGSLLMLLIAGTYFFQLEYSPEAGETWRVVRQWDKVQVGMPKADVLRLLGKPYVIHYNSQHFYQIHPLTTGILGQIEIESGRVTKIVPQGNFAQWTSPDWELYPSSPTTSIGLGFTVAILLTVMLASLMPTSLAGGWAATSLYYPLLACLCACIYESAQNGGGWRFDLVLLFPVYLIIGVTWLIRVILIARRERHASLESSPCTAPSS